MVFWFYIPGIVIGLIGILMMTLSFDNRRVVTWGLTLLVIALVAEAAIWFASLV
ncbi:MAG: hypothetical protein ABSG05_00145 [Candidatus Pacearchaeota archaeon]|jgi:hypothetical protein